MDSVFCIRGVYCHWISQYSFSPADFPAKSIVSIARGASAPEVAAQLADARVIAHPQVLQTVLRLSRGSSRIQAGPYLFDTPENVFIIARRLVTGAYNLPPARASPSQKERLRVT